MLPAMAVAALTLFMMSCADETRPPPPTFAVSGTVYDAAGKPLSGGIIQFISRENPALNMSSMIAGDGTYALSTIHENQNVPGAIQGDCQVLVTLPFVDGQVPQTVILPDLCRIEPQGHNQIDIRLDQRAKGNATDRPKPTS